ncbi:HNH endonuclease [Paenibacillus sp. RS8]|uniref:HNH nuclease domain-containing protein n=1 Tax=Paenibacillus odorifer TaxID=189426 RepID=A0A1R0Y9H2_9BACL|nr:HNH endonuclease [Paenibacillus odorifer]OMD44022.1 hypothetical protein BSK52_00275 [Paenibacillus odorifer]
MAKRKQMKSRQRMLVTVHEEGYRVVGHQVLDHKGNEVKIYLNSAGYPFFILKQENGKAFHIPVHRLVAFEKYGVKMFRKGIIVRHLNDVKNDFSRDNISIGTHKQNADDRKRNYCKKKQPKVA